MNINQHTQNTQNTSLTVGLQQKLTLPVYVLTISSIPLALWTSIRPSNLTLRLSPSTGPVTEETGSAVATTPTLNIIIETRQSSVFFKSISYKNCDANHNMANNATAFFYMKIKDLRKYFQLKVSC
ncbi:TPA: hypothetical protein ACGTDK_003900, partial [Salmonella enterica]